MKFLTNEIVEEFMQRYRDLPGGSLLYQIACSGEVWIAGRGKVLKLSKETQEFTEDFHLFVNEGNQAYYFLGNVDTSEEHPQNATVKLGITEPHKNFVPHAHGVRHFVKSQGFSGCILYDVEKKKAVTVKLIPGSILDIAPMVAHSFYNRSGVPLVTLIANAGLGLHSDKYAITKEQAEKNLLEGIGRGDEHQICELINQLDAIERVFNSEHPENDLSLSEQAAIQLYELAQFEAMRDH